jgi:hypothetical protein
MTMVCQVGAFLQSEGVQQQYVLCTESRLLYARR